MSQAGIINMAGGGGGGSPIQTVTGDSGGPVPPTANNINLKGGSSTVNNANGITVVGNAGTSTETFTLTNRASGSVTTTGAASANVITLPLGATPGVYAFDIVVAAFAKTGIGAPAGAGYTIVGAVRTTGAAATLIPTQVVDHFEEAVLQGPPQPLCVLAVSGNNALITVTGISDGAAGFVIDWVATLTYTFAS
jgi:hypothetical protein